MRKEWWRYNRVGVPACKGGEKQSQWQKKETVMLVREQYGMGSNASNMYHY